MNSTQHPTHHGLPAEGYQHLQVTALCWNQEPATAVPLNLLAGDTAKSFDLLPTPSEKEVLLIRFISTIK